MDVPQARKLGFFVNDSIMDHPTTADNLLAVQK